jgi:hypothetical protein
MEVVGKIKVLGNTIQVSEKFSKRELVVTTDEQYPQHILVEFAQDKCDLLNGYSVGQAVKVSINLRGREWVNPQGESKWFNSIQGWRIDKAEATTEGINAKAIPNALEFQLAGNAGSNDNDDLPF